MIFSASSFGFGFWWLLASNLAPCGYLFGIHWHIFHIIFPNLFALVLQRVLCEVHFSFWHPFGSFLVSFWHPFGSLLVSFSFLLAPFGFLFPPFRGGNTTNPQAHKIQTHKTNNKSEIGERGGKINCSPPLNRLRNYLFSSTREHHQNHTKTIPKLYKTIPTNDFRTIANSCPYNHTKTLRKPYRNHMKTIPKPYQNHYQNNRRFTSPPLTPHGSPPTNVNYIWYNIAYYTT